MRKPKRPIIAIIISSLCLVLAGVVIVFLPPTSVWVELGGLLPLVVGLGLGLVWLTGRAKYGATLTGFLVLMLVLNRLEILNWITAGLVVLVLGLITLIA